jgi:hypothetical protein
LRLQPVKKDATLIPLPGGVERLFVATLADSTDVSQALASASRLTEIEYAEPVSTAGAGRAEPDETIEVQGSQVSLRFPNDPYFSQQWALSNTGQGVGGYLGKAGADLDMLPAWELTTGSSEVVVAILSSGLRADAYEFSGRVLRTGYNFVDDNGDIGDAYFLGTFVTSVAAATGNNSYVMAGVDWKCSILPVKVMGASVLDFSVDWLVKGIVYAADQGAKVISIGLGNKFDGPAFDDAVTYAASKGIIIVGSAPSGSGSARPASLRNLILVGAVDNRDKRIVGGNGWADFMAPGKQILGLQRMDPKYTQSMDGPIAASALVTGVVSLMLSLNKSLTFSEVYDILKESAADQIGYASEDTPGWDEYYGWGRINAYRALRLVQERSKTIPQASGVSQNYPNPFNSSTIIQYELKYPMHVSITIYNLLGQPVVTLLDEDKPAGYHHVRWDAHVASGVYIYRLHVRPPSGSSAGERVITNKMILVR